MTLRSINIDMQKLCQGWYFKNNFYVWTLSTHEYDHQ